MWEAEQGGGRPEDAGAPRRRAPWDEPLGSHGITQHTHHPGPRNPLWGFTLGHDARRGKLLDKGLVEAGTPNAHEKGRRTDGRRRS